MKRLVEVSVRTAHSELWAACLMELRSRVGEERFARWIAPIKLLSESGPELRLGVANALKQDWIEEKYLPVLKEVLKRSSVEVEIRFLVDSELFLKHQEERARVLGEAGHPPADPGLPFLLTAGSAPPAGETAPGGSSEPPEPPDSPLEPTLENYVLGESNRAAHDAALQVLQSPGTRFNPLFIHGPFGVGKTHLLKGLHRAFQGRRLGSGSGARFTRATYLTGERFFLQFTASIQNGTLRKFQERHRSLDVLILDDVHLLVNKKKTQVEFLNTFSSLIDAGRQIVLASDLPPRALKDLDPGLVGRFLGGLVIGIRKPDLETRLGIARWFAARLPVALAGEVLLFVAEVVRATAREISGALSRLVHEVQVRGGEMTVERARSVLDDCLYPPGRRIDIPSIAQVVAAHYELSTADLISPNRQRHVARPRQVAMYLARRYTQRSLAEIGKFFGKRDHTTVKSAVRKIETLLAEAPGSLARDLEALRAKIEE